MLQRDLRQIAEIEKISLLPRLLRALAWRVGGLINDSDIARDAGLNSVTSRSYRRILQMMFIAFDVEPWYQNIGQRLVKSPKGYLSDAGMVGHMLGLNVEDIHEKMPDFFGHVLENFVAAELQRLLSFGNSQGKLFHFRTSEGKEIDFVIEFPDGRLLAIEIKKSGLISPQEFSNLQFFAKQTGERFIGGIVLHPGKDAVPFGKKLWAVPLNTLWH